MKYLSWVVLPSLVQCFKPVINGREDFEQFLGHGETWSAGNNSLTNPPSNLSLNVVPRLETKYIDQQIRRENNAISETLDTFDSPEKSPLFSLKDDGTITAGDDVSISSPLVSEWSNTAIEDESKINTENSLDSDEPVDPQRANTRNSGKRISKTGTEDEGKMNTDNFLVSDEPVDPERANTKSSGEHISKTGTEDEGKTKH